MYWICRNRVILGVDGFIHDPKMGSQLRIFCFGLNIWIAWGDIDSDGNGFNIYTGLPSIHEVL